MSDKKTPKTKDTMNTSEVEGWFIVKQASEQCKIVSGKSLEIKTQEEHKDSSASTISSETISSKENTVSGEDILQQWGPFETQGQAIAKRVGLIRAGKCQPVGDIPKS